MNIFKPSGVCAKEIEFTIEDNKVKNVMFYGGCPGSHLGISQLIKEMTVSEAIEKLRGITCGPRSTSCPDQLSKALEEYQKSIA
ncbi:TIGR03905 family TSCPD domain-containing protein [Lutibacter sp. B2]|nr:TIGR03905 family TSCPD domain-containing protein [Lutibacter sp. B2]